MATGTAKTDYWESAVLNEALRNTNFSPPATVYLALLTAVSNGETSSWTEVSGGSYARQSIAFNAPSGGACVNTSDVTFPTASAGWGTVVSFAIFDAATAGNALYYGNFTTSKTVASGDIFKVLAGQLSIGED